MLYGPVLPLCGNWTSVAFVVAADAGLFFPDDEFHLVSALDLSWFAARWQAVTAPDTGLVEPFTEPVTGAVTLPRSQ